MKQAVNIGHDAITLERAKAQLGDPRAFTTAPRGAAKYKVILKSRPGPDNKPRQKTFYFDDKN